MHGFIKLGKFKGSLRMVMKLVESGTGKCSGLIGGLERVSFKK